MRTDILSGIVGSQAYGLANEDSDTDRLGIFAWDTWLCLGLESPPETMSSTKPDVTMHEARKALRLLLKCNPTISELLWLPDDLYEVKSDLGRELLHIRSSFLSSAFVKNAYMGYATQQFRKLLTRDSGTFSSDIPERRTAKHARHLMRLVNQGFDLYTTGELTVRLEDPEIYISFGEDVARDHEHARSFMASAEDMFSHAKTVLPSEPDTRTAENWLLWLRAELY